MFASNKWVSDIEVLITEHTDRLIALTEKVDELEQQLATVDQTVRTYEDDRTKRLSEEPWVDVTGYTVDPTQGLKLNLDWNDAFIDQLRESGYTGTDEKDLVAKWLLTVSSNLSPPQIQGNGV